MFDLGTQELIMIFIVAFLVFGPKKLPELARTLGKGLKQLKSAMHGITESLEEAGSEIKEEVEKAGSEIREEVEEATGLEASIYESISANRNDISKATEEKKAKSKKEEDDETPRLFGDSEDKEKQQQENDNAVTTKEVKKEPGTDG